MTLSDEAKKYIHPNSYKNLKGRVLRIASLNKKRKREILFIYGSHASIERNYGIAEALAEYGNVTNPDLPGIGGMDSTHKMGVAPDVAVLADYLADFIKKEYGSKKITIAGFSLGFFIVTEMLKRHKDISKQVDFIVSIAGFTNKKDFIFSRPKMFVYYNFCRIVRFKVPATIYRYLFLNGWWLRKNYAKSSLAKSKFKGMSPERKKELLNMEVTLWHINDVQTWAHTLYDSLGSDMSEYRIDNEVMHIKMGTDQYFNTPVVVKHLKEIYSKVEVSQANLKNHSPTVISSAKEARHLIPQEIRDRLS